MLELAAADGGEDLTGNDKAGFSAGFSTDRGFEKSWVSLRTASSSSSSSDGSSALCFRNTPPERLSGAFGGEIPKSSRETGGVEPRGELLDGTEENVVPPDPNCRDGIEDGRPRPSDVGVVDEDGG